MRCRDFRLVAIVVAFVLHASGAVAQFPARGALADYRKGVKAVETKQWDTAIAALTTAIAQDSKDRTFRESTVEDTYFPHYYLFVAYLQAGNLAKARENFQLRAVLPKDLAADSARYAAQLQAMERTFLLYHAGVTAIRENRWQEAATGLGEAIKSDPLPKKDGVPEPYFPQYYLALADLRLGKATEAKTNFDARGTIPKDLFLAAEEPKFADELEFLALDAAGQTAFTAQRFQEAVDNWNKACGKWQEECAAKNLRQRISEAQQGVARNATATAIRPHVANAQVHVGSGDLDGARKEFKAALDLDAGNEEAAAGVKAIQEREDTFNQSKNRADQLAKANDLDGALREYAAAHTAHGQWYTRDKLEGAVAALTSRKMQTMGAAALIAGAQTAFQDSRWHDAKQQAEAILAKDANNADMKSIVERSDSRILYDEGRKLAAAGDFLQADQRYTAAFKKDSKNAEAQRALSTSAQYAGFVSQRNFDMARTIDKVRFDVEHPDRQENFEVIALVAKAQEAFDGENFGQAKKLIDEVLKKQSTNGSAIGLRNRIDLRLKGVRTTAPPVVAPTVAPAVPMAVWLAIAAVVLAGAGSLVAVRSRAPLPVAIDSLPWSRVTIQPTGRLTKVDPAERYTPFVIDLPGGEYTLKMTSDWMSEPYTTKIRVTRGQPNTVLVTMPAYDVEEVVAHVLK